MLLIYLFLSIFNLQHPVEEIHFGKGGGFAGMIAHYIVDSEGSFFQYNPFTEERTLIRKVNKDELALIWKSVDQKEIKNLNINEPGNTYKFIQIVYEGRTLKLVWSGRSPNNRLHLFYKELNTLRQIKE